jgi:type III secretion protein C
MNTLDSQVLGDSFADRKPSIAGRLRGGVAVVWVVGVLLVQALQVLQVASAAEPAWPDREIALQAQEQPLGDFLRELFQAAGLRALPSESVEGRISGRFADRPEKIFNDIVKAYDLLPYYDGTVMHVSGVKDMRSKSIRARPAEIESLANTLRASKLVDRHQEIQVSRESGLIKLRGAPEFIVDMEELIATQQRPEPRAPTAGRGVARNAESFGPGPMVFRSFQLKYASAGDQTFYQNGQEVRVPGVVTLLRSMMGAGGSSFALASSGTRAPGRNVPSVRGQGLRRSQRDGAQEERHEPTGALDSRASREGSDGGPPARIEADPSLNAVIVRDYEGSMQVYEDLIAQLDKEPQLIEIQVTIVDIDRAKLTDLGVDWRFDDSRNSIALGGGDAGPQNGGLLLNTVLGNSGNFLARVTALAKTGSAQVVSRPQVLTLSNLEAILATDQSFFVRVAGREDVDLFDVSVGTSLRVVPSVAGDAADPQIRLRVAIEDGSISNQTVDDIPIVDRATLNTQAVIYDGQSLLLGGLVRDETSKDTTKVPVLGDVPGIGRLFKRTNDVKSTQERLFLISPRIIASQRRTPAVVPAQPPAPLPPADARAAAAGERAPRNGARPAPQHTQAYLDGF